MSTKIRPTAVALALVTILAFSIATPGQTKAYVVGANCTNNIGSGGIVIALWEKNWNNGQILCVRSTSPAGFSTWSYDLGNFFTAYCDPNFFSWNNCVTGAEYNLPCTKSVDLYDNVNFTGVLFQSGFGGAGVFNWAGNVKNNRASLVSITYDRDAC